MVTKDKTVVTRNAISSIEEDLPAAFLRIHRSFIIALHKIDSFTADLGQIGKYESPVSRSYPHEVEAALKK